MASAVMKFSAILFLVAACAADESELFGDQFAQPVTAECLGCICHAISGCKRTQTCEGDVCGLFGITWPYWSDAGKHTINGLAPDHPDAYHSCVVDPSCAALTVQGYMRRYGRDCNGDGQVNCYDYMAIHMKGGYGCSGKLPYKYLNDFNQCPATVAARRQG